MRLLNKITDAIYCWIEDWEPDNADYIIIDMTDFEYSPHQLDEIKNKLDIIYDFEIRGNLLIVELDSRGLRSNWEAKIAEWKNDERLQNEEYMESIGVY